MALVVALSLLFSATAAGIVWEELKILSPLPSSQDLSVAISVSETKACLFDEFSVSWRAERDIGIPEFNSLRLSVSSVGGETIFSTKLSDTVEITAETSSDFNAGLIHCKDDPYFCIPTVKGVLVNTNNNKVAIEFAQDVSQPVMLSLEQLQAYLETNPHLEHEANVTWVDPRNLELELNSLDLDHIIELHSKEEKVFFRPHVPQSLPPQILYSDHNTLKFKPSTHGLYRVFIMSNFTNTIVSNEIQVEIDRCEGGRGWESFPPIPPRTSDSSKFPSSFSSYNSHIIISNAVSSQASLHVSAVTPPVLYEMGGVFALSGNSGGGFQLDAEAVSAIQSSSWSLSMWLKVLEPPTGGFRPLFYKGKESANYRQRSISVWMHANTNHLLVQATTYDNETLEFKSIKELELNRWTLVTFVYHNSTASPNNGHGNDAIEIYFDQHLDVRADILLPLAGNDASLQMFQDHVGGKGPQGFLHSLRLYLSALSPHQISSLYLSQLPQPINLSVRAIDRAISFLSLVRSPLLPFYKHFNNLEAKYEKQGDMHVTNRDAFARDDGVAGVVEEALVEYDDVHLATSTNTITSPSSVSLLRDIEEAILQCSPLSHRVSLLSLAVSRGELFPLPLLARLLLLGGETVNLQCGYSYFKDMLKMDVGELVGGVAGLEGIEDTSMSFLISLAALAGGEKSSLFLLAMHSGLGVGMNTLLTPASSASATDSSPPLLPPLHFPLPLDSEQRGALTSQMSKLWYGLGNYLRPSVFSPVCANLSAAHSYPLVGRGRDRLGMSPLCMLTQGHSAQKDQLQGDGVDSPTLLSLGLLYLSAMHNDHEAQVVLAHRYEKGGYWGVRKDLETSVLYSLAPVRRAEEVFHSKGGQPIRQEDRLTDKTEPQIADGNLGEEDEHLALLMVRGAEGDPAALAQLGDYYYYGGGGLPRDQPRAFNYYENAAARGHAGGMVGAANMLIKGEGATQNLSRALDLYETAASPPHTSPPALNGLGYLYFHGVKKVGESGVLDDEYILRPNYTRALGYFDQAGKLDGGGRGDALYNAGFMLDKGYVPELGGRQEAIAYYNKAAIECGHFDAVATLGIYYAQGKGVIRSPSQSLTYLKAARELGPWGGYVRRGLDLYLGGGKA
eukprot:gene31360-37900_t